LKQIFPEKRVEYKPYLNPIVRKYKNMRRRGGRDNISKSMDVGTFGEANDETPILNI